ncbi:hypothetical protein, partial [Vibrio vulnificus]|uniref:hypothetical protein n=1 Tax=Vibrio vulnificus TaxID=672 RepID=UPI0039B3A69E
LTTATTNKSAADKALADAQKTGTDDPAKVTAAQKKLKQDQDWLTTLKNAPQAAKDAAKALADAQAKLKTDQDALLKAQADAKVANANFATAQKLVDQDKAALNQAT